MDEPGYERYLSMEAFTTNPELWDVEKKADHKKETQELQKLLAKSPTSLIRPEKNRIIIVLRAQDYTIEEICKRVELTKPTVLKVIRSYASEIAKLKKLELEELLFLHHQTTRKKIELLGGVMGRLLDELHRRTLEDVPSDKLVDLIIKLNKALTDLVAEKICSTPQKEKELSEASVY